MSSPSNSCRVYIDLDYSSRVGLLAEVGGAPVAAGTYHRLTGWDGAAAEVAFIVEDAQQRRGLGSILLEHLAAAAQENGIRRFTAEVLAENNTMVRVFIDAGYVVKREYDSGVVDLEFDIAPTEKSIQVARSREHRAESRSIARLLTPRRSPSSARPTSRPSSATRSCRTCCVAASPGRCTR